MSKQWFYNWFGSPYYHLLYSGRDTAEAENFINNLYTYLKPDAGSKVLDVGCGRGRHAVQLNKKGADVTGIDLSVDNISYARQFENPRLRFYVRDMRSLYYYDHFNLACNLFTSFGYFETEQEHITVLKGIYTALKKDGLLVMDYFNVHKALPNMVADEIKTIDGVNFNIHKEARDKSIIKTINFDDKGESFQFNEIVKIFTLDDFKYLYQKSGFEVITCFGSYELEAFEPAVSDRLIMICKKAYA